MGRSRSVTFGFVVLSLVGASACELVADFDRSKIPVEQMRADASTSDDSDSGSADDPKK